MQEGRIKKIGLFLFLILSLSFFSTSVFAGMTDPVKGAHCAGSDLIACEGRIDCDNYQVNSNGNVVDDYNDPRGCATNAPSFCEEEENQCNPNDNNCDRDDIYCRGPLTDCTMQMCYDQTYQECVPTYEGCSDLDSQSCYDNSDCSWVKSESCGDISIKEFNYCSGTYEETYTVCSGKYTACIKDPYATPLNSFLSIIGRITGYSLAGCKEGETQIEVDCSEINCPGGSNEKQGCFKEYETRRSDCTDFTTEDSCVAIPGCAPMYKCSSCASDERKAYVECLGEYEVDHSETTCEGTYEYCGKIGPDGQASPFYGFLSLMTGRSLELCLDPELYDCRDYNCEEDGLYKVPDCYWKTTTTTTTESCIGMSESDCISHPICEPSYNCEEDPTIIEKVKECETCSFDTDCEDGFQCKEMFGTTNKVCVRSDTCAIDLSAFPGLGCSKVAGTKKCTAGDVYSCQSVGGRYDWNLFEDCESGKCSGEGCEEVPAEPNPILKWINPLTHGIITTSINTPQMIEVNNLPFNTVLLVEDPDESKDNTFRIKEGTDLILETKGVYNSNDNTYSYGFEITKTMLDGLNANENNIYELYYNIYEKTSPIFYLQASGLDHCSNSIQDYDEEDIDCGGLDCSTCCGNGICGNTENYTVCPADCPAPNVREVKWGVSSPLKLDSDALVKGVEIEMQLYNADNPQTATFSLREEDSGIGQSDEIIFEDRAGIIPQANPSNSIYPWNATLRDLQMAIDDDSNGIFEYVFETEGLSSDVLEIQLNDEMPTCSDGKLNGYETGVDCGGPDCPSCVCVTEVTCIDYLTPEECNADACDVLAGDTSGLQCSWNAEEGVCGERLFVSTNGIDIGNCFYTEDSSEDNCDDGFLSYSVNANWEWDPDNSKGIKPEGTGWIQDNVTGDWHYDPEGANYECIDDEKVIACPAQIQLSFFTWKNILAAVLLISIIYIALNIRREHKKHKEQKQKIMKKIKKEDDKNKTKKPTIKKSTTKKVSKKKTTKKKKTIKKTTPKKKK